MHMFVMYKTDVHVIYNTIMISNSLDNILQNDKYFLNFLFKNTLKTALSVETIVSY